MTIHWKPAAAAALLATAAGAADRTLSFKVEGWHSKGDAYKAEAAARSVKGVKSAAGDFGSKQLSVVFDDAIASEAQVRKALVDAGVKLP